MTLDAAAVRLGDLMLGERSKEASCRPAFLLRLLGELGPNQFDSRQVQLGEQQFDSRGIERIGGVHDRPPSRSDVVFGKHFTGRGSPVLGRPAPCPSNINIVWLLHTIPLQPQVFKLIKRIGHVARNVHLLSDGTSLACGAGDITADSGQIDT